MLQITPVNIVRRARALRLVMVDGIRRAGRSLARLGARRARSPRSAKQLFFISPAPRRKRKTEERAAGKTRKLPSALLALALIAALGLGALWEITKSGAASMMEMIPKRAGQAVVIDLGEQNPEWRRLRELFKTLPGSGGTASAATRVSAAAGLDDFWKSLIRDAGFTGEFALGTFDAIAQPRNEGAPMPDVPLSVFGVIGRKTHLFRELTIARELRERLATRYPIRQERHGFSRILILKPGGAHALPLNSREFAIALRPGVLVLANNAKILRAVLEEVPPRNLFEKVAALARESPPADPERERLLAYARRTGHLGLYFSKAGAAAELASYLGGAPANPDRRGATAIDAAGELSRTITLGRKATSLQTPPRASLILLRTSGSSLLLEQISAQPTQASLEKRNLLSALLPEKIAGRYVDIALEGADAVHLLQQAENITPILGAYSGIPDFLTPWTGTLTKELATLLGSEELKELLGENLVAAIAPDFSGEEPVFALISRRSASRGISPTLSPSSIPPLLRTALSPNAAKRSSYPYLGRENGWRERDQKREQHAAALKSAIENYFLLHRRYPRKLRELLPTFLGALPQDPSTNIDYLYNASADRRRYRLEIVSERGDRAIYTEQGSSTVSLLGYRLPEATLESLGEVGAMYLSRIILPLLAAGQTWERKGKVSPGENTLEVFIGVSPRFIAASSDEKALRDIAAALENGEGRALRENPFFATQHQLLPERLHSFFYVYTAAPRALIRGLALPGEGEALPGVAAPAREFAALESALVSLFPAASIVESAVDSSLSIRRLGVATRSDPRLPRMDLPGADFDEAAAARVRELVARKAPEALLALASLILFPGALPR